MNLYTCYTDSHTELFNMMQSSLERTNPNINLIAEKFSQDCETGDFMKPGWNKTMEKKIDLILHSIKQDDVFIHSDADVYFFKPIEEKLLEELGDFDIAFQDDSISGLCCGFFVARSSSRLYSLWEDVKNHIDVYGNDQNALNMLIRRHPIKFKMLPRTFFTFGHVGAGAWNNHEFEFDRQLFVAHANWTVGVQNKINLLNYMRKKMGENVG